MANRQRVLIDLRSDTVTKPTPAMLQAMLEAEVGDDVFGEDPTAGILERKVAKLFDKEAALFVPSGTMANQIAVKAHTQPMDEIILAKNAHIYYYETAGFAFHSGVSVKLVDTDSGIFTYEDVIQNIQPDFDWLPKTSLVCLENTSNKGGGSCYELDDIRAIQKTCLEKGLKLHIDGARIWNAIIAKGYSTEDIGRSCDSISVCFSKGLGAPIGSALVGDVAFIKKARRIRKAFGGGMRQVGLLAGAAIYALDHNLQRLTTDHLHAQAISEILHKMEWVSAVLPTETNIIIFEILEGKTSVEQVLSYLKENNILAVQFGPKHIRMVTHLDISHEMVKQVVKCLKSFST